jgi:ketosteroid isomerase-like protein
MKTKALFIVFLASILIINCSQTSKDVTNEIVEANKVFAEFFNAHNGKAIGELYTENGRLFPANSPVIEATVHVESYENTAIEEGAYNLFDASDNKLDEGKYIIIWKNIDGKWHLDRDIFSSNIPLPVPQEEEPSSSEDQGEEEK